MSKKKLAVVLAGCAAATVRASRAAGWTTIIGARRPRQRSPDGMQGQRSAAGAAPDFSAWSSRTGPPVVNISTNHRARAHPDANAPDPRRAGRPDPGIFSAASRFPMPQEGEMPRRGVGSGFNRERPTATS